MLRTLGASARRRRAQRARRGAGPRPSPARPPGLVLGLGMAQLLIVLLRGLEVPVGDLPRLGELGGRRGGGGILATLLGAALPRGAPRGSPPCRRRRAAGGGARAPRHRPARVALALFLPGLLFGGGFWFGDQRGEGLLWSARRHRRDHGDVRRHGARRAVRDPAARRVLASRYGACCRPRAGWPRTPRGRTRARTSSTAIALSIGLSVSSSTRRWRRASSRPSSARSTAGYARDLTVRPRRCRRSRRGGARSFRRASRAPSPRCPRPASSRRCAWPSPTSRLHEPGDRPRRGRRPRRVGRGRPQSGQGRDARAAAARVDGGGVIVAQAYAERAGCGPATVVLRGPRGDRRRASPPMLQTVTDFNGRWSRSRRPQMRRALRHHARRTARRPGAVGATGLRWARGRQRIVDRTPGVESLSTAALQDAVSARINQQFDLFNAIVAIAVLVSLLGVVNTLAMSVLERTREIGVLRALGASRWHVRGTMAVESLLIRSRGRFRRPRPRACSSPGVWLEGPGDMLPGWPRASRWARILAIAVAGASSSALSPRRGPAARGHGRSARPRRGARACGVRRRPPGAPAQPAVAVTSLADASSPSARAPRGTTTSGQCARSTRAFAVLPSSTRLTGP